MKCSLTNDTTGELELAIDEKLKGESEFGEVELLATGLRKVVFK